MRNRLRRSDLIAAAAGTTAAFTIVRAPARAAEFEYRAAHQVPIAHPTHQRQLQLWDAVEKETNGRLVVKVFPNGQLGGQEALLTQTRAGAIQFMVVTNATYSEVVPVAAIDSVGFAFRDARQAGNVMNGPLGDFVRQQFEPKGLHVVKGGFINLGMNQVTSSTKPIRTADDFTGFKIRIPGAKITVDLFKTLGAQPIDLAGPEIYSGLQTHTADGQETPYVTIEGYKLWEVQKYLSVTNHRWSGQWYAANLDAWKALPPDIQAIAARNIAKYLGLANGDNERANAGAAERLTKAGMTFNTADSASIRNKLGAYYTRWKAEFGPSVWSMLEAGVGRLG